MIDMSKAYVDPEKTGDPAPRVDTVIFPYIRRLRPFLGVQNFEFHYLGGGLEKNKYCFGYKYFVDILGGHHKIGLYLGVISMHFRVFS